MTVGKREDDRAQCSVEQVQGLKTGAHDPMSFWETWVKGSPISQLIQVPFSLYNDSEPLIPWGWKPGSQKETIHFQEAPPKITVRIISFAQRRPFGLLPFGPFGPFKG